jgi:predicted GNAT family acetyltransferase
MSPEMAQARVVDAPDEQRFEIRVGDEVAGVSEYKRRRGLVAFLHTEVAPEQEGKGLASRLISEALDAARDQRLAVLPFCPFVRDYIAKHPDEYLDLVPADLRQHFDLPAAP